MAKSSRTARSRKFSKLQRTPKSDCAAWEASKGVGPIVEKDLKEVVALRNEAAVKLGFPNFHALQLYLNEQEPDKIVVLFDELDSLTRCAFPQSEGGNRRALGCKLQDSG